MTVYGKLVIELAILFAILFEILRFILTKLIKCIAILIFRGVEKNGAKKKRSA